MKHLRINIIKNCREWAKPLKKNLYALYLACMDPRTPWYAKVFTTGVVGYAFSPIDLIPDFIPVLGYFDDIILVPLGIYIALKMIPEPIMSECRAHAETILNKSKPKSHITAGVIIALWILMFGSVYFIFKGLWQEV
ncbi:MAG: DUF1232 domain-containing protein [Desulfobacterales bacterium]|nr:DUF1232 domain-containing protein [Desulfobacterales bacterium]